MNAECKEEAILTIIELAIIHSFSPLRSILLRPHLAHASSFTLCLAALFYCVNARPTSTNARALFRCRYVSFGTQHQTANTKLNEIDYFSILLAYIVVILLDSSVLFNSSEAVCFVVKYARNRLYH